MDITRCMTSDSYIGGTKTDIANLSNLRARPISMWRLTVWAYRTQMVQYETDRFRDQRSIRTLADELGYRSGGIEPRGCINGAGTTAHDDAHILHAHVRRLGPDSALIVKAGRMGVMPIWNPQVPTLRVVPVRKAGGGSLRMIYGRRHMPVGCLIDYEGFPEDEIETLRAEARENYDCWWEGLRRLRVAMSRERGLTRWRIEGLGAPARPWLAARA